MERRMRSFRRPSPAIRLACVITLCASMSILAACSDAPSAPARPSDATETAPTAIATETSTTGPLEGSAPPDLISGCPSVDTVQAWAGVDWIVDSIEDSLETVGECDYFSVPYEPGSPTLVEGRYIILLSTRQVPVGTQLENFRAAGEQTTGGAVTDLRLGSFTGLEAQHPDGLFCQMMLQTGETSTLLVLVADPADEMATECEVAQRILAGVVDLTP